MSRDPRVVGLFELGAGVPERAAGALPELDAGWVHPVSRGLKDFQDSATPTAARVLGDGELDALAGQGAGDRDAAFGGDNPPSATPVQSIDAALGNQARGRPNRGRRFQGRCLNQRSVSTSRTRPPVASLHKMWATSQIWPVRCMTLGAGFS